MSFSRRIARCSTRRSTLAARAPTGAPIREIASGKIYGETAKADGEAAFKAMLGKPFDLGQPGGAQVGKEISPYGTPLGTTYAAADVDALVNASLKAGEGWAQSIDRGSRRRVP